MATNLIYLQTCFVFRIANTVHIVIHTLAFTTCSCHRIKAIFRQFELVLLSNIRTVRLSVSADIRLREGGHKLCSRQLTVNRPTAKAAKQPSRITARSAASWLWQANILSSMRAIILIYAQVQLLYGVYICACVCVCVLCAVCSWQNKYKLQKLSKPKAKNKKGMQWKAFKLERQFQYTYLLCFFTDQHTHTRSSSMRVCMCVCVFCAQ